MMGEELREADRQLIVHAVHGKYAHLGPLTDEAREGEAIAERIFIRRDVNWQQTQVTIHFDEEACRRMDRREFRQLISEQLNTAGDALMAAWDQLHGKGS